MLRIGGPAVEWQDLGGTGQAPTWLRKWNELGSPVASVRHSGLGIEIAAAKWISTSCVSRFLRLALLAPNIVKAILSGWADQRVMLERLERLLPVDWEGQRQVLLRAGV
jgi:hypothetical protein